MSSLTTLTFQHVKPGLSEFLRRCGKARGGRCSHSYMTDEQHSPQRRRNHPEGVVVRLAAGVALPWRGITTPALARLVGKPHNDAETWLYVLKG